MSIVGTWKTVKVRDFENGGYATKAELEANGPLDKDIEQLFTSIVKFYENGTAEQFICIPAEFIEEAKAEGAPVDDEGFLKVSDATWQGADGAYFASIDGQEFPMSEVEGLYTFMMGMILIEKF